MNDYFPIISSMIKLLEDDLDTDQMVPARFLRTCVAEGLGKVLFYDRIYGQGKDTGEKIEEHRDRGCEFPLSPSSYHGEKILLTGKNFGCGSSREHAAWALLEFGITVIIAPSFGDIFKSNALKNGLIVIEIDDDTHLQLQKVETPVKVDLERMEISAYGKIFSFCMDPFARFCLLRGINPFSFLLENLPNSDLFFAKHKDRLKPITQLL